MPHKRGRPGPVGPRPLTVEPPLPLTLIAAVARNGVIGIGNRMPWRLPGDMAHFRSATMGRPVIVGRKTYESIGGPLPGRFLVVLSRDAAFEPENAIVARHLQEARAQAQAIGRRVGSSEIMVAGGASVYAALLPHATTLLITRVDLDRAGDAFFPPIDPKLWHCGASDPALPYAGDEASYAFVRYARQAKDK